MNILAQLEFRDFLYSQYKSPHAVTIKRDNCINEYLLKELIVEIKFETEWEHFSVLHEAINHYYKKPEIVKALRKSQLSSVIKLNETKDALIDWILHNDMAVLEELAENFITVEFSSNIIPHLRYMYRKYCYEDDENMFPPK